MIVRVLFIFLGALSASLQASGKEDAKAITIESYYWRDFAGVVPKDAFSGGKDYNGNPIFIGQVLHNDKLIPGNIYSGEKTASFEFGSQGRTTKDNIKVLCTQQPEKLKWVGSNISQLHLPSGQVLLLGGYERGFTTYIGRAHIDGETLVGKVIYSPAKDYALYIAKENKSYEYTSFEILVYNPDQESECSCDAGPSN